MAGILKSEQDTGAFTRRRREEKKHRTVARKDALRRLEGNEAEEEMVALLQNPEIEVAKTFSS